MKTTDHYAAVAYKLHREDKGFREGARFRLDQLDGGQYFFRSILSLRRFAAFHRFHMVSEQDLKRLRRSVSK